jgi:AGCS family alanine or glycine:cation symporter
MTDLNEMLVAWTGEISGFMYTYILVILLVFVGIYFTVRTKGVQIRYIKDMFTQLMEKKHVKGEKSISSFQALMVSTASRVGTGNIAGIATAVATGGPGAIFWMWAMALIGAASAFIESTLAQIYKIRGKEGEFRGGPAYYIQQGLGQRWLGIIFAWALILCFAFGFNGLQAFNMTSALEYYIPDYATNGTAIGVGIVLIVFTAFVIFGGAKRISIITSIIVPIMAIAYIVLAVWTASCPPCSPLSSSRRSTSSPSPVALPARWSCWASSAACSPMRPAWARPPMPPPPPACRTR